MDFLIYFYPSAQPQQQQQQPQALENPLANMTSALTMPTLFGDERDSVIAKLNQLQALWGEGKAYYAQNAQPIPLSAENPFSRFKVTYTNFVNSVLTSALLSIILTVTDGGFISK